MKLYPISRVLPMSTALLLVSSSRFASAFVSKTPRYTSLHSSRISAASTSTQNDIGSFISDFQNNFKKAFSSMTEASSSSPYYTVAITGSTGLIGSALIDELSKQGKTVNGKPTKIVPLVRVKKGEELDSEQNDSILKWNPYPEAEDEPALNPELLRDIDVVVHLAGENVATGSGPLGFLGIRAWSDEKKKSIIDSRVIPSRALANAVNKCGTPTTLVGASGIGVYGFDFVGVDAPEADETSDTANSKGFLADISRAWESALNNAGEKKNRVVNLRFGVVMSKFGGALAKLYPIFFLGGGGNVGSGEQYFSFISARDVARAIVHTMETPSLKGPVNVCAPNPCTNAEFTSALGNVMGRPTILPLPAFVVKAVFGEMGEEMLLGGNRVLPKKLLNSGFEFNHPKIEDALTSAIKEENI